LKSFKALKEAQMSRITTTVEIEDFHLQVVTAEMASATVRVQNTQTYKRKRLIFKTWASSPEQYMYRVEYGNDEAKGYHTLEEAIAAYNAI
jgi:flagellar basal body rod protein FlgC